MKIILRDENTIMKAVFDDELSKKIIANIICDLTEVKPINPQKHKIYVFNKESKVNCNGLTLYFWHKDYLVIEN